MAAEFKQKRLFLTSTISPLQPGAPTTPGAIPDYITQIDTPPVYGAGSVITFAGTVLATVSYLISEVIIKAESPPPDPGVVISQVSRGLIPPDLTTEIEIAAQVEPPRPDAGAVLAQAGTVKTTVSYLISEFIFKTEPQPPDPGAVLSFASNAIIPPTAAIVDLASTEAPPPYPGGVISFAGTVLTQTASFPEVKIAYDVTQEPPPHLGTVISAIGSPLIQATSFPESKIAYDVTQEPPPYPGYVTAYTNFAIIPATATKVIVVSSEPQRPDSGSVIETAGTVPTSVNLLAPGTIARHESQRPESGSVIILLNVSAPLSASLPPIVVARTEAPSPDAGGVNIQHGTVPTVVSYLNPEVVAEQQEPQRPEIGGVITLANRINLPVTLIYPTVANAESQRPDAGQAIILTTVVSQVQKPTAGVGLVGSDPPPPYPGVVQTNASYVILSSVASPSSAEPIVTNQEFLQPSMGSVTFSVPMPGGGGAQGTDEFFGLPFRYKRLRPEAKERILKQAKRRKEEELFVSLLIRSGVLESVM